MANISHYDNDVDEEERQNYSIYGAKSFLPNSTTGNSSSYESESFSYYGGYVASMPAPYGAFFDKEGQTYTYCEKPPPRETFTNEVVARLPSELGFIQNHNTRRIGRVFEGDSTGQPTGNGYWGCKLCGLRYPEFEECPNINPGVLVLFRIYCKNSYCRNSTPTPEASSEESSRSITPAPIPPTPNATENVGFGRNFPISKCVVCGFLMGSSSHQLCGKTKCLFVPA